MSDIAAALHQVKQNIAAAAKAVGRDKAAVTLIAVSKTFDANAIRPALEAGQKDFGENRVQEAMGKWPDLRADFPESVLHLIVPLQTIKVPEAVAILDVIHAVDRVKHARNLPA